MGMPIQREAIMAWQDRITVDPEVRSGKPRIKGSRITVYDVLEYLAGGMSEAELRTSVLGSLRAIITW